MKQKQTSQFANVKEYNTIAYWELSMKTITLVPYFTFLSIVFSIAPGSVKI